MARGEQRRRPPPPAVTLIPDRGGVAQRRVLRLRRGSYKSPPTLSHGPRSVLPPRLGFLAVESNERRK
jgi:hypothetical protein